MNLRAFLGLIAFLSFLTMGAEVRAEATPLPPGEHLCQVEITLLDNFNGEANLEKLFNKTFGGQNTVIVYQPRNDIRYATLTNKNGADYLQILIAWNYVKDIWVFTGSSLVGTITGTLTDCN